MSIKPGEGPIILYRYGWRFTLIFDQFGVKSVTLVLKIYLPSVNL